MNEAPQHGLYRLGRLRHQPRLGRREEAQGGLVGGGASRRQGPVALDLGLSVGLPALPELALQLRRMGGGGLRPGLIEDYLGSNLDSYNHPNAAIEPRIPGIFQYYSVAEDELAKGFAGQYGSRPRRPPMPSPRPGRRSPTRSAATARSRSTRPRWACSTQDRTGGRPGRRPALTRSGRQRHEQQRRLSPRRHRATTSRTAGACSGASVVWGTAALLALVVLVLQLAGPGRRGSTSGFATWRPTLYAYLPWAVAFCWAQVLLHGERGKRTLFVLPAALFVVSMVVFPLIFGLGIAFSDWNLSSPDGPQFNGLDNVRQMWRDPFYWNALTNMVWYTLAIVVEYAIAFGLALLLNTQIRARKFFRVAFLLPLMLSPGGGQLDDRQVDAGDPVRPDRASGARTRLEQPLVLRLARDGAVLDHGDGRLDVHPVHDDHDPRRPAGDPARAARGRRGRWRRRPGGGSGRSPSR